MKRVTSQTMMIASALIFFSGVALAGVEYDESAPYTFLGWSKSSGQILRARKSAEGNTVVTSCAVGAPEGKCKVLCNKSKCAIDQLAAVKALGLMKPSKPAQVYYSASHGTGRVKKRQRSRIPKTKIRIELGKLHGSQFEKCFPLSILVKRTRRKLTCLPGTADGLKATIYLSPDKEAVAVNVSQYGEASAMGGYSLEALPLDPSKRAVTKSKKPGENAGCNGGGARGCFNLGVKFYRGSGVSVLTQSEGSGRVSDHAC
jgi:hypothetical protein